MKRYKVVMFDNLEYVIDSVNRELSVGWEVCGGLGYDGTGWYQAMLWRHGFTPESVERSKNFKARAKKVDGVIKDSLGEDYYAPTNGGLIIG